MNAVNRHYDLNTMEQWLENYFLDPLTSYFDQTQFRIDLYETDRDWIIEALLSEFNCSEITVCVEDNRLTISGNTNISSDRNVNARTRSIEFPYQISQQKITAFFQNGILEVLISKEEKDMKKKRFITLP